MIGATLNQTGAFRFRATRVGKDTMLAQIIRLVQQAQGSKAPIQRLADVVSGYFVPAVIFIAIATFVVWFVAGLQPSFTLALISAVSVLIIACPCFSSAMPSHWRRRKSWTLSRSTRRAPSRAVRQDLPT